MIKSARKPSSDPVQEKLRQSKADWNKEVSSFVNDLIHYKKLMNGWPNKFHMEKSMIKDPIPSDPGTIIGTLANDFNDIAQKGNGIIKQQLEYARTRKKKQMKQMNLPLGQTPATPEAPAAPTPDLSKQLSIPLVAHMEEKYGLVAEGSNPISRFFTRVVNPSAGFGSKADLRRTRMSMLNAAAETYKKLGKFQVEVVRKTEHSIEPSNQKLTEAWSKWTLVYREFAEYVNKHPSPKTVNTPTDNETELLQKYAFLIKSINHYLDLVKSQTNNFKDSDKLLVWLEKIKSIVINDQQKLLNMEPDKKAETIHIYAGKLSVNQAKLNEFINKFITPNSGGSIQQEVQNQNATEEKFIENNKDLEGAGLSEEEGTTPAPEDILPDMGNALDKEAALEKIAQDFLKKWVGKTVHQLSPFDKTSSYRIKCYNIAAAMRKQINLIMNSLEKGFNPDELETLIRGVNAQMITLRGMMRSLHLSALRDKRSKK